MSRPAIVILFLLFLSGLVYSQGQYPLQIGNVWNYQDPIDTLYGYTTRSVNDSLMPGGFVYTTLRDSGEVNGYRHIRQSGTRVYLYDNNSSSSESLIYDFSKTIGDTVTSHHYNNGDTTVVIVAYDRMTSVFGRIHRQWGFYEKWLTSSLYVLREVTDSIGLTRLEFEPGIIYRLSGARINGKTYGTILSVDPLSISLPHQYDLLQNYPNPFNNSTVIEYEIPHESDVKITVFDQVGRLITTLVDQHQTPGVYRAIFDATNVSSGIYYYNIRTKLYSSTKQLILIK